MRSIYLGDKGAALTDFGQNNLWGIPNQVLLALAVFLIIGLLVLGIISNFMNLRNVPGYHQNVVKGVIILLAVLLQTGFRRRK
jgi:ribose/xylose/arabinose/galactoside ABC-type transport system permease subunit